MICFRTTNTDGRTDSPIISTEEFQKINTGKDILYKLTFFIDEYYPDESVFFPKPELVFAVRSDQVTEHFHVPLLMTPFTYTTYRGS